MSTAPDPAVTELATVLQDYFESASSTDLPADVVGAVVSAPVGGQIDWSKIPWDRIAEIVFRLLPLFAKA